MFLSIIIPIHNVEDYIDECVKSCLNQNFKDYEIILVENASDDGSVSIVNKYNNFNNVKVYHLKTSGVSHARNFGLSKASGDYVWFVDGDDFILENCLSLLDKVILQNSFPDVVTFPYVIKKQDTTLDVNYKENSFITKEDAINGLYNSKKWSGFVWNKLLKRQTILENDLSFDEGLHFIEDLAFLTKLFLKANTFYVIDNFLYYYRLRETSVSNSFNSEKLTSFYGYELIENELKGEWPYPLAVLARAKVDFSRYILIYYYLNDKNEYKKVKKKYKNIILKNLRSVDSFKAKIGGLLTVYFPAIAVKFKNKQ